MMLLFFNKRGKIILFFFSVDLEAVAADILFF